MSSYTASPKPMQGEAMTKLTTETLWAIERLYATASTLCVIADNHDTVAIETDTHLMLCRVTDLIHWLDNVTSAERLFNADETCELCAVLQRIESYTHVMTWAGDTNTHIIRVIQDMGVVARECLTAITPTGG